MNKKKNGIKTLTILLIIALIIGVAATLYGKKILFAIDTYKAYESHKQVNDDELQSEKEANDSRIKDILDDITPTPIRDLTDDERKALEDGKISEDDAKDLILGDGNKTEQQTEAQSDTEKDTADTDNQKSIDDIIARIFLLRAEFLNKLDALVTQTVNSYKSLPVEQRGTVTKLKYADKLLEDGTMLESECDKRLEALLDELKSVLISNGSKTDVINEVRDAYDEQKRLKKIELVRKYE